MICNPEFYKAYNKTFGAIAVLSIGLISIKINQTTSDGKKKQIKVQKKLKRKVVQTDNLYVYKVSFSMICCFFFVYYDTHTHTNQLLEANQTNQIIRIPAYNMKIFFFFFSFFSCFEGGSDLRRGHTQKKLTIYVETLILLCKFM